MNRQREPQGCLFVILKLLGLVPPDAPITPDLPYQRKDYLLTKAERSFLGVLQNAVGNQYLIFAKVRLADLVFIPRGTDKRQSHFNRIQSKHIDFVLCDHDVVRPLLAIELDDSSHNRADRQERDGFVDSALAAAGLPILHVTARSGYNVQELANAIQQQIQT
ncbi:MAG: DUF2726 domain-containing protein [Planctomycetaceae bacterium]